MLKKIHPSWIRCSALSVIDPYDHFNCQKLLCASAKIQTVGYWVKTPPLHYPNPSQMFVHFTDNHFIFVLFSALCLFSSVLFPITLSSSPLSRSFHVERWFNNDVNPNYGTKICRSCRHCWHSSHSVEQNVVALFCLAGHLSHFFVLLVAYAINEIKP